MILHERPASSAESEAKPKGPLPTGAPARPSGTKPGAAKGEAPGTGGSGSSSKGGPSSGASRPPASGGSGKGQVSGAKAEASGGKTGDESAAGAKGAAGGGRGERPGTVKVIIGTRRYHSTACPLIRGAGETGVETMTLAAAEAAGLTSCSVCQHDRETVG
ncbi:hypothetical protein ACBJ59_06665 [Nonomuraea sp. MTCD27]|uniref:hypothetical protein n=1 Tax=Nonomuraea sp. MTCD27 TaxID=1676747 RepID=UPI0035BFC939